MSCNCLSNLLARENTVLIVKFTIDALYDQYWALVPPLATPITTSAATTSSTINNHADNSNMSVAENKMTTTVTSNGDMIFMRLIDSDKLFIFDDQTDNINTSTATYQTAANTAANNNSTYNAANDTSEEDVYEMNEYLHKALITSIGPVTEYDPLVCPSGTWNYMVSIVNI